MKKTFSKKLESSIARRRLAKVRVEFSKVTQLINAMEFILANAKELQAKLNRDSIRLLKQIEKE